MVGYLFKHQQLRSCTFGMWLLSQISVFCPLLSGVGMGLLGLTPFIVVYHLTHRNHTVQTVSFRGATARVMFRNLIGSGSSMGPQRWLACLSARLAKKGGEEPLPSPQLPSIICIQWPSNPPVLFPSDPSFNCHLSYFHIILISMLSLSISFLSSVWTLRLL